MATLTIRKLDDDLKAKLRVRAARQGRSMEEEARAILRSSLTSDSGSGTNLAERIRARFAPLGGLELAISPRGPGRGPIKF